MSRVEIALSKHRILRIAGL